MLARHCAPVLCGKKPAELLGSHAVPNECGLRSVRRYGLSTAGFTHRNGTRMFLFYRPDLLGKTLSQAGVRDVLFSIGYPKGSAEDWKPLLRALKRRFRESDDFPHEIGFFLGYPVCDVLGFMQCNGEGCKLCGPWKVYGDVEQAKRQFAEFAYLKRALSDLVESGERLYRNNLPEFAG
jgi:hypothetical protein